MRPSPELWRLLCPMFPNMIMLRLHAPPCTVQSEVESAPVIVDEFVDEFNDITVQSIAYHEPMCTFGNNQITVNAPALLCEQRRSHKRYRWICHVAPDQIPTDVEAARRSCAFAYKWCRGMRPWSPRAHRTFAPEVRATVRTVMLIAHRIDRRGDTRLPTEMWWLILACGLRAVEKEPPSVDLAMFRESVVA